MGGRRVFTEKLRPFLSSEFFLHQLQPRDRQSTNFKGWPRISPQLRERVCWKYFPRSPKLLSPRTSGTTDRPARTNGQAERRSAGQTMTMNGNIISTTGARQRAPIKLYH